MSLLSIINDCSARLSLVQTTVVVTSIDKQITQLWALLNEEGRQLAKRYYWQALVNEWTFTTTNAEQQPASVMPLDFDRFINNSTFNRTTRRGVLGPVTAQRWQAMKAQPILS